MILDKEVLIKSYKGYGGFCIMSPELERFASKNKDDRRKVKIVIVEDK